MDSNIEKVIEIIKWAVATIIAGVPTYILYRRTQSDIDKTTSDSVKEEKKVESEVAESIIKSAGELIDTYKSLILRLEEKQATLEKEIKELKDMLAEEVKHRELEEERRSKAEYLTKQLLIGMKRLTLQLKALEITPAWQPDDELMKEVKE